MSKGLYKDFFYHFDILVMIILFIGISVGIVITGFQYSLIGFFIAGLVTFMFSEYLTHRFLFHLKAPKNSFFLNLLKRLHYDHHKYPNDLKLLFLPIWYSIPNLSILAIICFFVTGSVVGTLAFSLGLILMFLFYEWKHYIAHRPIKPKTRLGIWVKKTHILHHYKNENYWYGVSTPFVDVIFGTLKDEKQVETSQTAKDLEQRG
ncbi:sterol desaturase family protein [Cytobacillus spongiae]|jgi:sterol desaturase/sphingolipid hydroxylase (fatty acid hydroxylase superfamily)|uniref:sterol desaturase family protein n=1 Tax=Cytobacillus spongiae TaxID=2901381 RepID=UPI001F46850B|nr:sterol desaturase family protein [Cytobacillus spongiae]UII54480.1 sterol desaturase family protein [Cytobacillus spongiae]